MTQNNPQLQMDKLVFVKELRSGVTRNAKPYPIVIDQDNEQWNIWNDVNLLINGSYLFSFVINDKGYKDIKKITPLVNVFKQKALKEVANKNDITKNLTVCLSYSKDLVIGEKLQLGEIYIKAQEMYDWLTKTADNIMPKEDIVNFEKPKEELPNDPI
jgi:hypothetical protein